MSEQVSQGVGLTLVIFGATGDLSTRKLLPALFDLHLRGYLPKHFRIVGVARRALSENEFRNFVRVALVEDFKDPPASDVTAFLSHCFYTSGKFEDEELYHRMGTFLTELDNTLGACQNRLFYLAVPPYLYEVMFDRIAQAGIARGEGGGWVRLLVEKPFGSDLLTARKLDRKLGNLFKEEQIFRIDHYLAKASVQNILAFRFSNALFEETWSAQYIERVHIKLFEKKGVEYRGSFYDGIGALRDVGQNHVLQMLAMVAMDNPRQFGGEALCAARGAVFAKLRVYSVAEAKAVSRFGQYEGYRTVPGVNAESTTETYFNVTAGIDNDRWRGVPFILEAGKGLHNDSGEIDIWYKAPEAGICHSIETGACQNRVTIGINPVQYVSVRLWGRKPGLHFELEPHDLRFELPARESVRVPDAYAKVLYDGIAGERTLFMTTQELEAAWRFITPFLEAWKDIQPLSYPTGTDPLTIA